MKKTAEKISIVIPVFNEKNRIRSTMERITQYLTLAGRKAEIIVIDDGSTDNTVFHVSQQFTPRYPLTIISLGSNQGKGAAVKRGMEQATGSLVLFTDADLSTPIEELDKLEIEIKNGADIVIGSRGLPGSDLEVRQPIYRQSMGKIFNFMVRKLLGLNLSDTQCGFKLFKRKAAAELFPLLTVLNFAFDVELLYLAVQKGFTIKEVPVVWRNDKQSRVRLLRDSARMLWSLWQIRQSRRK